eukprot:CAMPEP_0195527662 /NCGR_PEP_ID=MMETSP0794_2-20130614/29509_1 /TAXON_ID=515487 /ORGANISM="Stephanopyxis turris, Strain CCMP 815" /LENGTH=453 /DNA_ID=CAMNT_0040658631 /DNA_START=312 /DNA_END=1673 /DNA_ORIENTATION=+
MPSNRSHHLELVAGDNISSQPSIISYQLTQSHLHQPHQRRRSHNDTCPEKTIPVRSVSDDGLTSTQSQSRTHGTNSVFASTLDLSSLTTSTFLPKSFSVPAGVSATREIARLRKEKEDAENHQRISSRPPIITQLSDGDNSPDNRKKRKVMGSIVGLPPRLESTKPPKLTPQLWLENCLAERGYSSQNFCSLEGGYYCKPTPHQKASYGTKTLEVVRQNDYKVLDQLLQCGLNSNPCNAFGESLIHMVCRRGKYEALKVLVDHGCILQISDDFGRTPLHDACWTTTPCFKIVEKLLDTDVRLLNIVDCRGSTPLAYVTKGENYRKWIEFFESVKDKYWPNRRDLLHTEGEVPPPKLTALAPHTNVIPEPEHAASIKLAMLLSSGKMDVEEALKMSTEERKNFGKSPSSVPEMGLTAWPGGAIKSSVWEKSSTKIAPLCPSSSPKTCQLQTEVQ